MHEHDIMMKIASVILAMGSMFFIYVERSLFWFLFCFGLALYSQFYGLKGV